MFTEDRDRNITFFGGIKVSAKIYYYCRGDWNEIVKMMRKLELEKIRHGEYDPKWEFAK